MKYAKSIGIVSFLMLGIISGAQFHPTVPKDGDSDQVTIIRYEEGIRLPLISFDTETPILPLKKASPQKRTQFFKLVLESSKEAIKNINFAKEINSKMILELIVKELNTTGLQLPNKTVVRFVNAPQSSVQVMVTIQQGKEHYEIQYAIGYFDNEEGVGKEPLENKLLLCDSPLLKKGTASGLYLSAIDLSAIKKHKITLKAQKIKPCGIVTEPYRQHFAQYNAALVYVTRKMQTNSDAINVDWIDFTEFNSKEY